MHIVIFTLENDNVEHVTTNEDNEVESREKKVEGSAWLARVGAPRTAESPCDPCVNHLLSSIARQNRRATYNGSPLQSGHALHSTFSSLSSTLDAHCKVSTHYFLLSSPYPLLRGWNLWNASAILEVSVEG